MNRLLSPTTRIAIVRLTIGLLQGDVLYWLYEAQKTAPPDRAEMLRVLFTVAIFIPLLAIVGVGNLRRRTFAVWIVAASLLTAGLAYHAVSRLPVAELIFVWSTWSSLGSSLACLLFIGNALVTAGDADRKVIANFPTYFDVSWKHLTQLALAVVFVGLFWVVLWLGAQLFRSIRIEMVATIIQNSAFWMPATTLAVSLALHLTDSQAGLVRGARTLLLNLMAWLMPMLVLIGAAFLVALFFTGLDPLWHTRWATTSLIVAAALLILLINSHFQDGESRSCGSRILLYARFLAALMLVPLVALASVGLGLRVDQYGWTPSRVIALAYLVMLASHAIGYAFAAVRSGPALRGLPITNVVSAFVVAAGLLALLTPIADPARISVASQVAQLEAGRISPEKFDFAFLQRGSGRYGTQAYERLKTGAQGPNAKQISARIEQLAKPSSTQPATATAQTRAQNITVVRPANGVLPADFLGQEWKYAVGTINLPRCLTASDAKCDAFLIDLNDDNQPEILTTDLATTVVFTREADGKWVAAGQIRDKLFCSGVRDALKSGNFEVIPPRFKDIEINGERLQISNPLCARPRP